MKDWSRRKLLQSGIALQAAIGARAGVVAEQEDTAPKTGGHKQGSRLRERLLLDFDWRFHFGNADDAAKDFGLGVGRAGGFQKTGDFLPPSSLAFDDGDWKLVDLPHDWVVGLPFQNDPSLTSKGSYPIGRGYPETSVGWYRKVFELPAADTGRRINVEFDGAYRETMVIFNGFYVGRHSGGYDPFSFDLTDFAYPGKRNVLLVRVDATLSDGWFYEGAGLYRHVWMVKTAPVHVKKWGTFANAKVQAGSAAVSILTEVENHSTNGQSIHVISTILDPNGKEVGKAIGAAVSVPVGSEHSFEQQVSVKQPALWSLEERNLHTVVTEVHAGGALVDRSETRFGIRSLKFDADRGFLLNSTSVKVKGTCNHQDHAGLGVALPDAMQRFRILKLQEIGCNAIRTSHNPPTPELLDACDELGMLVLDETRMLSSNPEGLAQFSNLIRRDRNHPSVFIWSMGNEESIAITDVGLKILTGMKQAALRLDDSRPISIAPPPAGPYMGKGGLVVCDVMGYNYADPQAEEYHKANPKIPVIGTENVSAVGTRGVYITDPAKGYVGSYDADTNTGRASAQGWWRFVSERPWVAGGFVWTGFDYRGEPSPYQWPNISSQYGVIDLCGFPKDTFYYYQSWWTNRPVLHVLPHWNWSGLEGKEIAVWVYSNLERVELLHNGQSLGPKDMPRNQHLAWNVKYAAGTLEARGYKNGQVVMTAKRETAGEPVKLMLEANRAEINADGEDIAVFSVKVVDAKGVVVPITDNSVTFTVKGSANLIGVGNGDPTSHESDIGQSRKAFGGLCMAIVQSSKTAGRVTLQATSPGLIAAEAAITTRTIKLRSQLPSWERAVPNGEGITGLWRPGGKDGGTAAGNPMALEAGGDIVFLLHQQGNTITGEVEATGGGGVFAGAASGPIENGVIDGSKISFRAGTTTYSGTAGASSIELQRSAPARRRLGDAANVAASADPRPAVGPPLPGVDPSFGPGFGRGGGSFAPLILRRVNR